MTDMHPTRRRYAFIVPAAATGASSYAAQAMEFDGVVTSVTYVPTATVTGAATNNRTLSVTNKGQAGAGSTTVASLTFASGTNATGFDETAVTLSGTAANLAFVTGDVLSVNSVFNGTGIAEPGGTVYVNVSRS